MQHEAFQPIRVSCNVSKERDRAADYFNESKGIVRTKSVKLLQEAMFRTQEEPKPTPLQKAKIMSPKKAETRDRFVNERLSQNAEVAIKDKKWADMANPDYAEYCR